MIRLFVAFLLLGNTLMAAPIPKSIKAKKPDDLVGTKWITTKNLGNSKSEYTFLDNGVLQYRFNSGDKDSTAGTWTIDNAEVTIEINKYSFHTGLVEGDSITLQSKNKAGMEWVTVLTKQVQEK